MSEAKQAMRAAIRRGLSTRPAAQRRRAATRLCETLWAAEGLLRAACTPDAVLMAYMALPDEIDPTMAMQRWLDEGGRLAAPVSMWETRELEAHEVDSLNDAAFEVTRQGIREPRDARLVPVDELSVVLVPGVAFDQLGNRLGRGAGFYDRFLSRVSPACTLIGVCHSEQVQPSVPCEGHDRPVGHVVAV